MKIVEFVKKHARPINITAYLIMPMAALFMTELLQEVNIYDFSPQATVANYLLFLVLYTVFLCLSASEKLAVMIATPLMYAGSLAAKLVLLFRGTVIMPADVVTIGTALNVVKGYNFTLDRYMVYSFLVLLAIEFLWFFMPTYQKNKKEKLIVRAGGLLLIVLIMGLYYTTDIAAKNFVKPDFWNQERGYKNSGTFLNFVLNTKYILVQMPDGYLAAEVPGLMKEVIEDAADNAGTSAGNTAGGSTGNSDNSSSENADSGILASAKELQAENPVTDRPVAVKGTSDKNQPKQSARLKKGQMPDIIMIMNETYSDLSILGDFTTNIDYMPYTRSLTKNTIKGNLYVPVNGAGTSNSEFEALTGNTMAFLTSGSNAYQLYLKGQTPSLAHILKSFGYSATGFHPYFADSWNRSNVYPFLGFDEFISLESLFGQDLVDCYHDGQINQREFENTVEENEGRDDIFLRRFVSDYYDYEVLEDMYEKRDKSKPFFMFNVTMQNHGGYENSYVNFDQQVRLENSDNSFYPCTNRFLSLMYESDQALKELIDYFDDQSRPVIILMFGDHQPGIEEEFLEKTLGSDLTDLSIEQTQSRYVTPFVLWANFDIEEGYIDKISSNYLSALLLQTAGLEGTTYTDYLSALYKMIPVIDTNGYITADGTYHTYDEDNEYNKILNAYRKIQYNNIFDSLFRQNSLFYRQKS